MVAGRIGPDQARLLWEQRAVNEPVPHSWEPGVHADQTHGPVLPRVNAERSEQILRTLERGRIAHSPGKRSVYGGVNGTLPVVTLVDQHGSGTRVKAVLKKINGGGAQEVFAHEVSRAMRLEHLLPHVGRRAGGVAAIELVPRTDFEHAGISSVNELDRVLRHRYDVRTPEMSAAEAGRRARVDRQLVQAFDQIIANGDRHHGNGLVDSRTGTLPLIDHGLINWYDPLSSGAPRVRMQFMEGLDARRGSDNVTSIEIDAETHRILARTNREHIRRAFGQMLRDVDGHRFIGVYARRMTPAYLDQLLSRLDEVVTTGALRVAPGW